VFCYRLLLLQHPNKDVPSGVQPQQQQLGARARGREYKRHADLTVVLTLVNSCAPAKPDAKEGDTDSKPDADAAADEAGGEQQQQQQQPVGTQQPLGGDYDGPEAVELQLSGIPQLPPDTVGPPSPVPGMPDDNVTNASNNNVVSGGMGLGAMQQQQGGQQLALQLQSRHSSASVGLEQVDGEDSSLGGGAGLRGAGGSGGLQPSGSAELQPSE
jgi:hypothetical protein